MCINYMFFYYLHISIYFICSYYYDITMKKISIALTLGIILLSSALIVYIPRNINAQQQEEGIDYIITEEEIKTKILDLKQNIQSLLLLLKEYQIWI